MHIYFIIVFIYISNSILLGGQLPTTNNNQFVFKRTKKVTDDLAIVYLPKFILKRLNIIDGQTICNRDQTTISNNH